ncbi:MotA/TolQ/ExbB proton channel family protein [candidate division WOR-3 bacterium]|nr:MotA/TolQ/ExbB proton channel family protein [candidate division WOR-3 bacterium]
MLPGTTLVGLLTSPWIIVLLITAAVMIVVAIERFVNLRKVRFDESRIMQEIERKIEKEGLDSAINQCRTENSPLTRVLYEGLKTSSLTREDTYDTLEKAQMKERAELETRVGILSTIAFIAPLLGLLGTVVGIIQAFSGMAEAGGTDPTAMMSGVAVALLTTATGIIIAVPSAILFSVFSGRVDSIIQRIEIASKELMVILSKSGKR